MRSQIGVEVALQRSNLCGCAWILWVKPLTLRRIRVGLVNDVGRVGQHPIAAHQNRNGRPTPSSTRSEPVDELQVRLLSIPDARAIQGPASLFAVVANRNRDQDARRAGWAHLDQIILTPIRG
jgi:hypothetical protein